MEKSKAVDPAQRLLKANLLPEELTKNIDLEKEIKEAIVVNPLQVIKQILTHRYPSLSHRQDCTDILSDEVDFSNEEARKELYIGAKLAFIAYALPYYMPRLSTHFHMKNVHLSQYLDSLIVESLFYAFEHMDAIVRGEVKQVELSAEKAQMGGFYIRTPIQIWNKRKERVYRIPSWEHRTKLTNHFLSGNVNVYVLRQNTETGFECYVCFRGTSSEFNSITEFGNQMRNTQVYSVPHYDPLERKNYLEGDENIPLFYYYVINMIEDVWPYIEECLSWLKASSKNCERVIVSGHSMGASMVLAYCYLLYHRNKKLWDKTYFRCYATPMTCNHAAILRMEQWMIDSMQPNKFIEGINTDDFVNVQYLLGGKDKFKDSIQKGVDVLVSWIVSNYPTIHKQLQKSIRHDKDQEKAWQKMPRMMRIIQLFPESAISAFLHGALVAQLKHVPEDKHAGFRMGQRSEEIPFWGSKELRRTYNRTVRIFFCRRRINWDNEYLGKAHSNYMDLNMTTFWSPIRMYEDRLYNFYAQKGLRENNELRIIPIFPAHDLPKVLNMMKKRHANMGDVTPKIEQLRDKVEHEDVFQTPVGSKKNLRKQKKKFRKRHK